MSERNSEIEKKLDDFLQKITETIFLGVQEKTKEISDLHREIRDELKLLKNDTKGIFNHLEKLNSKVATHESKFVDVAIKHAHDDEQIKSLTETQETLKKLGYFIITGVVVAVMATIIK